MRGRFAGGGGVDVWMEMEKSGGEMKRRGEMELWGSSCKRPSRLGWAACTAMYPDKTPSTLHTSTPAPSAFTLFLFWGVVFVFYPPSSAHFPTSIFMHKFL